jgi:lipopolysaccharide export system protein LptA
VVLGVFVSAGKPGSKSGDAARVLRVTSAKMDYSDKTREAVFAGGVTMKAAGGDVRSQRAVVIFNERPVAQGSMLAGADVSAGSVDHAVAIGDVRIQEPGRTGTGEQLTYTAATDSFVLTGTPEKPPRVADEQQGNVVGTTLLFGASDSTIVVAGQEGAGKRGRVRTETTVTP